MTLVPLNPPLAFLGASNAIVAGRARAYEVGEFAGPLSVKSVVSGRATWRTARGEFELLPGFALILNEGEPYSMSIDSLQPVETHCVFFSRGFVEDAHRAAVTGSSSLLDGVAPPPAVEFFGPLSNAAALVTALAQTRDRDEESVIALADVMVRSHVDVASRVVRLPALRSATRAELLRRVARGTDFIHGHFCEPLPLARVASAASLSPFHFHRLFTAVHGETPHALITRLRLARAGAMLRSGNDSVIDVATACGFSSVSSFTSLFRRAFGFPPAAFRKIGEAPASAAE